MAKKFTPPPVDNDPGYSPLAENVQEKNYSAPNAPVDNSPIPEPSFTPPSFAKQKDFFNPESEDEDGTAKVETAAEDAPKASRPSPAPPRKERTPIDPGYNEMSGAEKKRGAEGMANAFIQGYSILCKQGAKWVMIKPEKVQRLVMEGKINADVMYQMPGGVMATAPDIINSYNAEMSEVMEVSDEFVDQVRPLLVRIFMKRGLGMSDEAQLMWIVGQDIFSKGVILFQIKKQSAEFIKAFTIQNAAANTPPIPDVAPTPPAQESVVVDTMPDPEPTMAPPERPKMPDAPDHSISPTLQESSPENFFDPVNIDAKVEMPKFGDNATLRGLAENEKLAESIENDTKTVKARAAKPKKSKTKKSK